MSKTIKNLTLIALLAALAACGGSDDVNATTEEESTAEEVVEETGTSDAIVDTASDVVTTLADVNGFKIISKNYNPDAYGIYGNEVEIDAFVKDHSNNPVEDGTVITFVTDDNGFIENQCATVDGQCTVKWWSAGDRTTPDVINDGSYADTYSDFKITVMARTIGEDSFIDKNSNSEFDIGESYSTQSEPFLDVNDNDVYDSGINDFDEFFDFNDNGEFDDASDFTTFRGESCSTTAIAAGHCANKLEVWDTLVMSLSSGYEVTITLFPGKCSSITGPAIAENTTLIVAEGVNTEYCVIFTDENGNVPASGAQISASGGNGELVKDPSGPIDNVLNAVSLLGTGYAADISLTGDDTPSDDGSLEISVTPAAGDTYSTEVSFPIQD